MTIHIPTSVPYLVGYRERDTPVWYWWRATDEAAWTSWKLTNNEWVLQGALSGAGKEAIFFHFGLERLAGMFPVKSIVRLAPRTLLLCRRELERQLGFPRIIPHSRPVLSDGAAAEFVL